ncbi:MAG: TetR/AcrR family transcriptional regulator [Treponema sp.]|jgi:AcrR family transcriptional regulator|nr:TetR/AcrR family transcriptional regulator [Treponema sp.]
MTRQDIIGTAFRVWGRQAYKSTSLTDVARELGVSKPALYRHFKNKEALVDALSESFFNRYAAFIKPAYEKALSALPNETECLYIMTTAIAEYYIRNVYDFVFSVVKAFDKKNNAALLARGVDFSVFVRARDRLVYPSDVQLVMATVIFIVAHFHKRNFQTGETPTEEKIEKICRFIVRRIKFGMELDRETVEKIKNMDYEKLERRVAETIDFSENESKEKNLLDAVGAAIAEVGPWKVSMDLAARKSGLSKSGLYCYFAGKDDMLDRFFTTEFNRLVIATERGKALSDEPVEQFYLIIAAMAEYLRSRPDILATVNWLKTQTDEFMINWRRANGAEYDPEETFRNPRFSALFSDIFSKMPTQNAGKMQDILFPNIVPFLVVNILMSRGGGPDDAPHFRVLFKFLTMGIDGGIPTESCSSSQGRESVCVGCESDLREFENPRRESGTIK